MWAQLAEQWPLSPWWSLALLSLVGVMGIIGKKNPFVRKKTETVLTEDVGFEYGVDLSSVWEATRAMRYIECIKWIVIFLWRDYRRRTIYVIIAVVYEAAFEITKAILVQKLFESAEDSNATTSGNDALLWILIWSGILILLYTALVSIRYVANCRTPAGAGFMARFRMYLTQHILQVPHQLHMKMKVGRIIGILQGDVESLSEAVLATEELGLIFLRLISTSISLVFFSWRLSLVVIVMLPILLLYASDRSKYVSSSMQRANLASQMMLSVVEENLRMCTTQKILGHQSHGLRQLREARKNASHSGRAAKVLKAGVTRGIESLGASLSSMVLCAGAILVQQGLLSISEFLGFYLLSDKLVDLVQRLALTSNTFESCGVSLANIVHIMDLDEEPRPRQQPEQSGKSDGPGPVSCFEGEIVARDLFVGWQTPLLSNVSFVIPSGSKLAIVGSSGAGKSTLMKTLIGLIKPASGQIQIGTYFLRELESSGFMSVVEQDVKLWDGTIMDNLLMCTGASREDAIKAVQHLGSYDDIMELPEGFETEVGPSGVHLAGGLRQRIALAHAFVRDKSILVVDEPTSALDPQNSKNVALALSSLRTRDGLPATVIAVTHDMSLLEDFNLVAVIGQGALIEFGDKETLLAKRGKFWQFMHQQEGVTIDPNGRISVAGSRLVELWIFVLCSAEWLDDVADLFASQRYEKESIIIHAGQPNDTMHLIVQGNVSEVEFGPDGEVEVHKYQIGETFRGVDIATNNSHCPTTFRCNSLVTTIGISGPLLSHVRTNESSC